VTKRDTTKPAADDGGDGGPDLEAISKLSYEAAIERLEELIDRIESGEIGLEASVAAYEEGMALKAHCESIQDRAEQRVRELDRGRDGGSSDVGGSDDES